jgi:chitosanase
MVAVARGRVAGVLVVATLIAAGPLAACAGPAHPVIAAQGPAGDLSETAVATPSPTDTRRAAGTSRFGAREDAPGGGSPSGTRMHGMDLADPREKDIALQLVSSAENSTLDWRAQYSYIEDIGDGRGYTAGLIGFCSGTGDLLDVIVDYTRRRPDNVLAKYLPALRSVNGSSSHAGLDPGFPADWRTAADDQALRAAQDAELNRVYFDPAVNRAKADGLRALGQFSYFDAMVMHGPGDDADSFGGIRRAAMGAARTPAQGGDEGTYINAFLNARAAAMTREAAHEDTSRVDAQRSFLRAGNLDLVPPLTWQVYGDSYHIG